MVKLNPGDRVNCRIKECEIVVSYKDYDEIKTFEIVAVDEDGLYLFVPDYYVLKDTIVIDQRRARRHDIDPRFIGEKTVYINESMVCQVISQMDGMCCSLCQDFCPMAEPNQEDEKTFICWSCRDNPYH